MSFITFQALDANNDPATSGHTFSLTVSVTGSAIGGGTVQLNSGTGTTFFTNTVAETVTISLTNPSVSVDVSATQTITFLPGLLSPDDASLLSFPAGATSYFTVTLPSAASTTVDAPVAFLANARDQYGNIATGENRSARMIVVGNAVGSPVFLQGGSDVFTITSGAGSFTVSVTVAQQLSITLRDLSSNVLASSQNLVVKNGLLSFVCLLQHLIVFQELPRKLSSIPPAIRSLANFRSFPSQFRTSIPTMCPQPAAQFGSSPLVPPVFFPATDRSPFPTEPARSPSPTL